MLLIKNSFWILKALTLIALTTYCQEYTGNEEYLSSKRIYYATKMQGTLCGYSEIYEHPVNIHDKDLIRQESHTLMSFEIMDKHIETVIDVYCNMNSVSGLVEESGIDLEQGGAKMKGKTIIDRETAIQISEENIEDSTFINLPEGTLVENLLYKNHLLEDFLAGNLNEKTYSCLSEFKGKVIKKTYTFEGYDTIYLAGKYFPAIAFTEIIPAHGIKSDIWIHTEDAMLLRMYVYGQDREMYLTDHRVKDMLEQVNLENLIFYNVNQVIHDFKDLSYMKLDADIFSVGDEVTYETLNFPGQTFKGTVEDNHIRGTFELSPVKYNGVNAPRFPIEIDANPELEEFLKPGMLIESDDPNIVRTAKRVTDDSRDAWEAAVDLSKWVNRNIEGAIPGGGTAKGTYDQREGECGGHSRLHAAMCRAVGIPAKVVIGCMYVPDHGGFFGQHAWTEVYMGDEGWIPVDATIGEVDYIDAGHIKLGEGVTFHPKFIEILDYRIL